MVEATGDAQAMADSIGLLRRMRRVPLGSTARDRAVEIDGRVIGVDQSLETRVVFGSVSAHGLHWLAAVASLERVHQRWPAEVPSSSCSACVCRSTGSRRRSATPGSRDARAREPTRSGLRVEAAPKRGPQPRSPS